MNISEKQWTMLCCFFSACIAWFYFDSALVILPALLISRFLARREYRRRKAREKRWRIRTDFKLYLEHLSAQLNAGRNLRTSMQLSTADMKSKLLRQGRERSEFLNGMEVALEQMEQGGGLKECAEVFLQRIEDPLIHRFWELLLIGAEHGANIPDLALSFYRMISAQEDLIENRKLKLYAAKREQYLLFAMPLVLMGAMRITGITKSSGAADWIARMICLGIFLAAWRISLRILHRSGLSEGVEI